jgi:hypothetical protein
MDMKKLTYFGIIFWMILTEFSFADSQSIITNKIEANQIVCSIFLPKVKNSFYFYGNIYAREMVVTTGTFPDYVFSKDYQLMTLKELENYIDKHKHLPGLPSGNEVAQEGGIKVGELNAKLLEKIEELTLHIIKLQKRINELEKAVKK